jgi:hypothetical protein
MIAEAALRGIPLKSFTSRAQRRRRSGYMLLGTKETEIGILTNTKSKGNLSENIEEN